LGIVEVKTGEVKPLNTATDCRDVCAAMLTSQTRQRRRWTSG